ncbi:MAG: iron chelate uptake ABC transporter family permease subunit [Haemophilus parainfluenzae]|nr:iron chelate uptake ABC transporter family permease subunit [Haemophilus parainfluenzae]
MRTSHVSFRTIGFYVITLSLMVLLFGLSIRLGTYTLSFEEIWAAFQPDNKNYFTLMEYRLPRAVLAILLGGALAISGVLVQSVVRNPLASPDILGINNAAGLVAVSVLMFLPNLAFYWMPIFAFFGLLVPHLARFWIGYDLRKSLPMAMLLGAILMLAADTIARAVNFPSEVPAGAVLALIGAPVFVLFARGRH